MLGKSGGLALGLAILFTVSSCARIVVQDSKSGEDAKEKGAKPMTLDNGEAKAHGIVTYPGGDRVDWKMVELPSRGQMDIKLQWQPPRPGLQLSFDVFDEWNTPIVQSKKQKGSKKSHSRVRTATVDDALKGKYFIRIF